MRRIVGTRDLAQAMAEQGLVPPNCHMVEIVVGVDGALVIRYEVLVQSEDLSKITAAFQAVTTRHEEGR